MRKGKSFLPYFFSLREIFEDSHMSYVLSSCRYVHINFAFIFTTTPVFSISHFYDELHEGKSYERKIPCYAHQFILSLFFYSDTWLFQLMFSTPTLSRNTSFHKCNANLLSLNSLGLSVIEKISSFLCLSLMCTNCLTVKL